MGVEVFPNELPERDLEEEEEEEEEEEDDFASLQVQEHTSGTWG